MTNKEIEQLDLFKFDKPVIKGYPELRWTGKRPYTSTQFFPAQLKEKYGEPDETGWINKIFWGDNLQVMSHLLKEYRGKIDLVYIDPPFDSKADYKKTIEIRGKSVNSDNSTFEEKQYGDIWTNDEYLQFMYERLILIRELLSDKGSIYLHCDYRKVAHLKLIMDEIFGVSNFRNEIIWTFGGKGMANAKTNYVRNYNSILFYSKTENFTLNLYSGEISESVIKRFGKYMNDKGQILFSSLRKSGDKLEYEKAKKSFIINNNREPNDNDVARDYSKGSMYKDTWNDIAIVRQNEAYDEFVGYPTQKPEALLERIIKVSSNSNDLVFDCFMGSGTTQAIAMKLGRRFIGADINLGAIQTTTKRLLQIAKYNENNNLFGDNKTGFEVYNVNNYDFFRNPIEARDLLIEALGIQKFSSANVFDGELDGRHVKILPVNRIATKADLKELVANLPYKFYDKLKNDNPNEFVDRITLICMGHEPDLKASLQQMIGIYKVDIEVVDILKDKGNLEFKRDAQADIVLRHNDLVINSFYPMNLLQKLSIQKENVDDWRQLVDSIMIDYDFDGITLKPQIRDVPEKNDLVKGKYSIPLKHGRIRIKITDLLSESLEKEVE